MLLLEVEKRAKALSKADKVQLIRDVQQWLQEETGQEQEVYPAVNTPKVAGQIEQLGEWKYNLPEMYEVAKNLQAYKDTLPGPKTLDESKLIYEEGCDV